MHPFRQPWVALLFLTLVSCDSKSTVSGSVTYDGKPVESGVIAFVTEDADGQLGTRIGTLISNGSYSFPPEKQLQNGTYRVEITWNKVIRSYFASPSEKHEEVEQLLPSKYNTESTLKAEIKTGLNRLDFDLAP